MSTGREKTPFRCRVLIADDHGIVRAAIRHLLEAVPGAEIVGEAADGIAAIALTKRLEPDLLLLDVAMPQAGGVAVIGEVHRWSPTTRVAILTGITAAGTLQHLLDSGAVAILLKSAPPEELERGLRKVVAGEPYVDDALRASLAGASGAALTMRERQVLALVAQGRSNGEIAALLNISAKTADNHRTNLMRKLDLHSAAELTAFALREGLA